jgi:hypothetical protein
VQANGGAVIGYTGDGVIDLFIRHHRQQHHLQWDQRRHKSALTVNQSNTGSLVQASQFVNAGNGQTIASLTSAIANNASITNDNNPLECHEHPETTPPMSARRRIETAYEFGTGSASANGVGNSLVVGQSRRRSDLEQQPDQQRRRRGGDLQLQRHRRPGLRRLVLGHRHGQRGDRLRLFHLRPTA